MKCNFTKTISTALMLLWLTALTAACYSVPETGSTVVVSPTRIKELEEVILTMGAWRSSTERINHVLDSFHLENPHIVVNFDPVLPMEYDAVIEAQLKDGTAPDIFYLRSFSASEKLFRAGYLESLEGLPGLEENFAPDVSAAWSTEDGVIYGVPFTATSHGIYYNKDVFKELGLTVPETWDELLVTAQTIEKAGYIPFANASRDPWTIAEIVFMNLAPNFIGGREGRLAYLSGERCFNDERVVAAFQAVKDLAPFFPENHELLGYLDSLQLFLQGKAAMWMSGSWDIPDLEAGQPDFAWSVFAVPPPAGQPAYVTFHPDVAIGLNAASEHKQEAREFLTWLTKPEFGQLLGNEVPGFFPMHKKVPPLTNVHANDFLALNEGRGTDIRFAWEKLREDSPDGYSLMQDNALAVLKNEKSPQEAANALQAGLARWFEPAKACGKEPDF